MIYNILIKIEGEIKMIFDTVSLPFGGKNNATLKIYCQESDPIQTLQARPTVLVFPGGGYEGTSFREAECVALKFCSIGYNAAVLDYSAYDDARFPQPLCEAALAFSYLKENHKKYNINPDLIYTCGFSAGGHLALSLGVFWNQAWLAEKIGKENSLLRPAAQIICYPVVTSNPDFWHKGSMMHLVGDESNEEGLNLVSLENHVSPATPPTFLWTTLTDKSVPCENSLLLANAFRKEGVPMEFHLFGWGPHGLSLADRTVETKVNQDRPQRTNQINPHVAEWFPLCKAWLEFMENQEN